MACLMPLHQKSRKPEPCPGHEFCCCMGRLLSHLCSIHICGIYTSSPKADALKRY